MESFTKQRLLTYVALLVFLAIRIPVADLLLNPLQLFHVSMLPAWTEGLRSIQHWTYYLWENGSFVFVGIIIFLNRFDLRSLNVDRCFVAIFVIGAAIYCRYFFWPTGWIAAFTAILLLILAVRKELEFTGMETNSWRITTIILVVFFLGLLLISDRVDIANVGNAVQYSIERLPFAAMEEFIFRGLLWMFLRSLKWSEFTIVIVQAIVFWLSHAHLMLTDPVFFWAIAPFMSMLLGIIVWRSRSISSSTVAHVLFNLWWWLN